MTPKEAEGYEVLMGMDSTVLSVRVTPGTEDCRENEKQDMSGLIFQ